MYGSGHIKQLNIPIFNRLAQKAQMEIGQTFQRPDCFTVHFPKGKWSRNTQEASGKWAKNLDPSCFHCFFLLNAE